MKLSGAQIIVEALIDQGCDTVFGYPGGQVLNIYDELYKNSDRITHVLTAHEQGASHAADGYARATGKVGVVIATSGPGATNLVTNSDGSYHRKCTRRPYRTRQLPGGRHHGYHHSHHKA